MRKDATLRVATRAAWRAWLRRHHAREAEIWLVFPKRHTGQAGISYDDALDEALCFGWIDSIVRRLDDDTYARKFTPRRVGSVWSARNRRRVARLIWARRMTLAGLAKINFNLAEGEMAQALATPPTRRAAALPKEMARALQSHPEAWAFFNRLAPSYRRNYVLWLTEAKRPETRARRLEEAIARLAAGKTLGLK